MSRSIKDPELGEVIFINNIASISEKATEADFAALRTAYEKVHELNHEIHCLQIKLHQSDSKCAYMTKLLFDATEQLRQQSLVNFRNQVLFEL
jgi:hypothetical protein